MIRTKTAWLALTLVLLAALPAGAEAAPPPSAPPGLKLEDVLVARLGTRFDQPMKIQADWAGSHYREEVMKAGVRLELQVAGALNVAAASLKLERHSGADPWRTLMQGTGFRLLERSDLERGVRGVLKRNPTPIEKQRVDDAWKAYEKTVLDFQLQYVTSMKRITGLPEAEVMEILAQHYGW